jgi:ribonuclease R
MKKNNKQQPKNRGQKPKKQVVSFIEELKSEVAAFFEINSEISFTLDEIYEHFDAQDPKLKIIIAGLLEELRADNQIAKNIGGQYRTDKNMFQLVGKVEHVNKGYAFVVIDGHEDVWVNAEDLKSAIDGDTVQVVVFSDSKSKRRREGRVEKIVERGRTELVGSFEMSGRYPFVVPDGRRIYEDILIRENKTLNATATDKVLVKITQWPTPSRRMEGEVIEVLGKAGENNTEMHAILAEFGLPYRFSAALEAEANLIPDTISEEEIGKRRDMRGILTFTIDPADAKDFDDALSVQFLDNGNYEIGVHIADVSHYIQPNTNLEREAYARATSVYLVDRTVPMLPEKISNNLCSLRPNEDKLTFSAVFEINDNAKIVNEWFGRTVIHSDKRFSYEEAQEELDSYQLSVIRNQESEIRNQELGIGSQQLEVVLVDELKTMDSKLRTSLVLLNTLALKLRSERFAKGAINFETVEVKFKLDEAGKPLGVYQKIRKDSNKLIEEFMLLANKRVAEFVYNKSRSKATPNTMVYRVHEEPNIEKLRVFAAFANKLGYKMKVENDKEAPKALNELLANIEGKPEQNILEQLAVRTMAKARYTTEDLGHFGLAFRRYSHFTSPIRRYPDVMAHRLLQHYIDGKSSPDTAWYEAACKQSSEREKMASDAERASIKYKQVEFMSLMEPERVWDGVISGVAEFGIFVEIKETSCEGMIRMTDLKDDFYEYDKANYRIVGQRSKRMFTFGDAVKVRVKDTNMARRSMDLSLVEGVSRRNVEATRNEKNRRRNVDNNRKTAKPRNRKM